MSSPTRINVLGLSRTELETFFTSRGEKSYRAGQVMQWIYHLNHNDFAGMTNLSKEWRRRLDDRFEISLPQPSAMYESRDGTVKWLMPLSSGRTVETVLIPDRHRNTLCISSQVGCMLNCSFCATGTQGFDGNLPAAEIVGQVLYVNRWLARQSERSPLTNVVFMGMGEPLLNFDAAMTSADTLMEDMGFGLSKRRVTISTAGVVPAIWRMCGKTDASLAVSLHAPVDELRDELVPLNRRYPIADLLDACRGYLDSLDTRRVVTFEYTLIDGVNDSETCARVLHRLLSPIRHKLNLIPFNPFPETDYRRPSDAHIARFRQTLSELGHLHTLRTTRGSDINAACGQLVGRFTDRSTRRARLQRIHTTQ